MTIKKIFAAAATAAVLSVAGAAGASADSWNGNDGYGYQSHGDYDDNYRSGYDRDGDRDWRGGDHDNGWHRGWYGHDGRRYHHVRYNGRPFWYHGRYVVRSYDRFGRVSFVEVGPNGGVSGDFRF